MIRIVKLTFQPSKIETFKQLFETNKIRIRNFEGCRHLELLRDKNRPEIFFTYSYWNDEDALNNYRHSEVFKEIWTETKTMFSDKPEAWSVDREVEL